MDGLNGGKTGRDDNGRFAPGCNGGPGRPRRETEREYYDAISTACGPEQWNGIIEKAIGQAQDGDKAARDWLTRFLLPSDPGDLAKEDARPRASIDDLLARIDRRLEHNHSRSGPSEACRESSTE